MRAATFAGLVAVAIGSAAACSLNPQPLPPDTVGSDGGASATAGEDAAVFSSPEGGPVVAPVDAGAAGRGRDAGRDAGTDGADASAASDAARDAAADAETPIDAEAGPSDASEDGLVGDAEAGSQET